MAKDRFYPKKPHVNVGTIQAVTVGMIQRLTRRGFTSLGAYQIAHGLVVTNPADRHCLAKMVAETAGETGNVVQKVEPVFKDVSFD